MTSFIESMGDRQLVISRAEKTVSYAGYFAFMDALYHRTEVRRPFISVVDFSDVVRFDLTNAQVRDLVETCAALPPGVAEERTIFYSGRNALSYGMLRMVLTFKQMISAPVPAVLARTPEEVIALLGPSSREAVGRHLGSREDLVAA